MATQDIMSALTKILERLDNIEQLLNKNNEYVLVNTRYPVITPAPNSHLGALRDVEAEPNYALLHSDDQDSDSDIPEEETYDSDSDESVDKQLGKLQLLTPNQVQSAHI